MVELSENILAHPENQQILDHVGHSVILDFTDVDTWGLGTHPDLMSQFWGLGIRNSPKDQNPKAAIGGKPALINPTSGIIYGLAGGTSTHVLRLPPTERAEAIKSNGDTIKYPTTTLTLDNYGDKWAFISTWSDRSIDAWHRAAYDYADS